MSQQEKWADDEAGAGRCRYLAVGRHDQIVGAITDRFGGIVDSLTLRGDGVGEASEVPRDLVQDIQRVPHPYRGLPH
jgi:hypothetical protein